MKNKVLIDTNVALRFLLDDIDEMALIAEHVIDGDAWTTPEVLAEMSFVLDKYYGMSRKDIHACLCIISHEVELVPPITEEAIRHFGESNLDFVDCMMTAYAEAGYRTFSFDKGINRRISEIRRSAAE